MDSVSLIDGHIDRDERRENCLDCQHFVSCESGKQFFHKATDTPCEQFQREVAEK